MTDSEIARLIVEITLAVVALIVGRVTHKIEVKQFVSSCIAFTVISCLIVSAQFMR